MNSTSTKRIPVKSIEINRAEGHPGQCYPSQHDSWESAEARLMNVCLDTPTGSSKCDFTITWLDGETYKGTYSAKLPSSKHYDGTLGKHVRFYLEYSAGLNCPSYIPEADYHKSLEESEKRCPGFKTSALRMLQVYALDDAQGSESRVQPSPTPAKLEAEPTKEKTMATTSTQTANPQPMTAKEEHDFHTAQNAGKPLVAIPGNTFIIRGLLYRLGGKWDGTTKVWSVPEHSSATAKRLAVEQEKPKAAANPALPGMTPLGIPATPTATATKAVKTKVKPDEKLPPTAMNRRLLALLTGAEHVLVDLKGTSAEGTMHSVVQLLEGITNRK